MKFTAAGDALIQQRIPMDYAGFGAVRDYISRGDARFFNLETTLNYEGECFASQFSGGTYLRTNPEVLDDLLRYGFNMTSFNNNHAMDFSYDGLLLTLDHIQARDLMQSGVGRNLHEAAAPHYLDTPEGRVALISVNTTFDPSAMAGAQSRQFPGRPGINGLRYSMKLIVTQEDMDTLMRIGNESGINDEFLAEVASGYHTPWAPGTYQLGNIPFAVGEKTGLVTQLNETDMNRVLTAIFEAQLQADYILVSFHTHDMTGVNENVPPFIQEFCHRCIDAGAHAVIGHGPHILRGIEIYKDRPIFHSLGDFVLQLYSVSAAPEDFYEKQGLTSDVGVHALLKKRSKDFKIGLMEKPVTQEAVIPYWEMEDGELTKLELLPITCYNKGNKAVAGLPVVAENPEFLKKLAELSKPYGVKMELVDGIVRCSW